MNLKSLNQPITLKTALKALAVIALGIALFFGVRALYSWMTAGPPSPRMVKKTIRAYLKKQSHQGNFQADFDLKLKETVVEMQTNVFKLRQQIASLQTNIAGLRTENATLRRELATLQEQAHSLKYQVQSQETEVADKQKRSNVRQQELGSAQTNVLRYQTNLLAAKDSLAGTQSTSVQLTNELSTLETNLAKLQEITTQQTNLAGLQKQIATTKESILAKQQQLASTRSKLKEQQLDIASRETRLEAIKTAAASAQTNVFLAQSNLLAFQKTLETKRSALEAKQKEIAAKNSVLTAKQKEVAARQTESEEKNKELVALQRELANKQQLLSRQYLVYAQEIRKKVNEASSYQSIYTLIGQQLWLADRFLEGKDVEQKPNVLRLAMEASQHAAQAAENNWLAARICEGYLWPNLDWKDANGARVHSPEDLLQVCGAAFRRAEEPENVIKNYQITLKYITNEFRADAVRYYLGYACEQAGRLEEAMQSYHQVQQNTNYIKEAEQRLEIVKKKHQQLQASK